MFRRSARSSFCSESTLSIHDYVSPLSRSNACPTCRPVCHSAIENGTYCHVTGTGHPSGDASGCVSTFLAASPLCSTFKRGSNCGTTIERNWVDDFLGEHVTRDNSLDSAVGIVRILRYARKIKKTDRNIGSFYD